MKKNPLIELEKICGQAVWLDYVRRDLFSSGELKRLIDEDGLSGMTSNPTIFEKSVSGSSVYDGVFSDNPHADSDTLYEKIAIGDIQQAADFLFPVYRSTNKADGYACLEVSPKLANDTPGTIKEARYLWKKLNRSNVMIKVPATREGIPAIEELLAEGININITLMFTMTHYEEVAQAYIRGLNRCQHPANMASVASFFVSRVDTVVDKALEAIGTPEALDLCGQAAIANSQMIYRRYLEIFEGSVFADLKKKGARVQRPLWASTSTKNPQYSDVMYIERLIGNDTVNTMTPETINAFRDHGQALNNSVRQGKPQEVLAFLSGLDIDLDEVGNQLQIDGVKAFVSSFEKLMNALEEKTRALSH